MDIKGKWNKNQYKLIKLIGSGNFGKVYKILDSKGEVKAIKISEDILSITNEYNGMKKLKDIRFIPKTYDFDDWEFRGKTYHFIIMDYINGKNLKEIYRYKDIDSKTIFKIGLVLIHILEKIDRLGYKYTDIKLENIIIDKMGNMYFVDFGSIVEKSKPTKEYTPNYNINSWNVKFDYNHEVGILFSVTMIIITLLGKKEYNPLLYDLDQIIDKVNKFPIDRRKRQFLIKGLIGEYRNSNEYSNSLSLLLEGKKYYNSLSKIDYLLIMSIVSFVFVIIVGIRSILS